MTFALNVAATVAIAACFTVVVILAVDVGAMLWATAENLSQLRRCRRDIRDIRAQALRETRE